MMTSEYDIFREDAYDFADKLRKQRKLLDFGDYSGVTHAFDLFQEYTDIAQQFKKDVGSAFEEYLFKW